MVMQPWEYFVSQLREAREIAVVEGREAGLSRARCVSDAARTTLGWLIESERWPDTPARILVAKFVDRGILWSLLDERISSLACDLAEIWREEAVVVPTSTEIASYPPDWPTSRAAVH